MANGGADLEVMFKTVQAIMDGKQEANTDQVLRLLLGLGWATYNMSAANNASLSRIRPWLIILGAGVGVALGIVALHAGWPDLLKWLGAVPPALP